MLSMWCELHDSGSVVTAKGGYSISSDIVGPRAFRALPFRPIWPGFLANSAIYSAVALIPWIALRFWRMRRRVRKGWCPKCAYDLRFDLAAGCPECGWRRDIAPAREA
jgi:hypothetical protein